MSKIIHPSYLHFPEIATIPIPDAGYTALAPLTTDGNWGWCLPDSSNGILGGSELEFEELVAPTKLDTAAASVSLSLHVTDELDITILTRFAMLIKVMVRSTYTATDTLYWQPDNDTSTTSNPYGSATYINGTANWVRNSSGVPPIEITNRFTYADSSGTNGYAGFWMWILGGNSKTHATHCLVYGTMPYCSGVATDTVPFLASSIWNATTNILIDNITFSFANGDIDAGSEFAVYGFGEKSETPEETEE